MRDCVRLGEQPKLALWTARLSAGRDRWPEHGDDRGAEVRDALELGREVLTEPVDRLVGVALLGMESRPEAS